ncbi:MarR family winged helix-turn-helix transcriptional regulator [Embleya hyalina]|uniref:MarR family transcriptional regulator n=1 Tax=Embleya hyalina TaxID=516124 RepID=A0A401YQK3_9ACTN|nr:MarR family transcriptional regulator [Embleya hyalina]GCD96899.1 MarR family transcriptional regulator [Embleya hyalina]
MPPSPFPPPARPEIDWRALHRIDEAMRQEVNATLVRLHNITSSEYAALSALARAAPGTPLRLNELVDATSLSQSSVSRLVDRLVEGELVERHPCPDDRRGIHASITAHGFEVALRARISYLSALRQAREALANDRELAPYTARLFGDP